MDQVQLASPRFQWPSNLFPGNAPEPSRRRPLRVDQGQMLRGLHVDAIPREDDVAPRRARRQMPQHLGDVVVNARAPKTGRQAEQLRINADCLHGAGL